MPRGITILVGRAEAIRAIGAAIRTTTSEFEKKKREYPKQLNEMKKLALARLQTIAKELRNGITPERMNTLLSTDVLPWQERKDFTFTPPTLNVCQLKHYLEMLQKDVREVIPINSNSDLWDLLETKCEIKR